VCRLPSFLSYSRKVVHSSYVVGGYCRPWVFGTEVVEPARTWTRVVVVWFVTYVGSIVLRHWWPGSGAGSSHTSARSSTVACIS